MWDMMQYIMLLFVEEVYECIKDILNEFEVIMNCWFEYIVVLENVSSFF